MDNLIFDLGVSDGNDTAYYLSKGFHVVGVEADPVMFSFLQGRFCEEIADGRLIVLNNAASDRAGDKITINVHQVYQGISGVNIRSEPGGYKVYEIPSISWKELVAIKGVPRYVKIDIEGCEGPFLEGMNASAGLPEFISVEAYQFDPIRKLHEQGYTRFVMVDQNPEGGLRLPPHQREGVPVEHADFTHASGPFGLDVFENVASHSFEEIAEIWKTCSERFNVTWFDCHARRI